MKKLLLTTTAILTMSVSAIASEASKSDVDISGLYISPKFMMSFNSFSSTTTIGEDGDDTVVGGALAIGYDFNQKFQVPVRAELEFAARSSGKDKYVEIGSNSLSLNGFYDFRNDSAFTPYIGAGIGMAFVDAEAELGWGLKASKDVTNFSWNVGAGVNYEINSNVALGLGYRYVDFGEAELEALGASAKGDVEAHEFVFSLKYTF